MNHRLQPTLWLIATILILMPASASAVDITFRVRMSEQILVGNFDPIEDFVDLAGTFNGWGNSPLTPLADADGDSIYEVVLSGFTPDEIIEYKFRINGLWDGTEEFPGYGSNRVYSVLASGNVIEVWYNNYVRGVGELGWWNDTVFYEIFVRSFQDSDGDGIGDLVGLTQRLDYLNDGDPATDDDLGITGIWLMPINDSPSYHGYDTVDYRSINPDYGTMADFQAFLAAAHARGIRVIIDYVMNHCSNEHPWFQASEANHPFYRDWFRWEPSDPVQSGPWGQNVWHWNNSGWFYGLFWGGMPDLNYGTAAVQDSMFDTASWWLDTVGVDGFRLDAVLYIDEDGGQLQNTPETLQFWQEFNAHIKDTDAEAFSVGEAWTASNTVVHYVIEDRLDICFEFDLAGTMLGAVNGGDADYLGYKANQVYNLYPHLQFGTFLTNHDQNRSFTVLEEDLGKAKAAAGIYLTLPGVPFLYYGEEIGMTGDGAHENIRTPMQWTTGWQAGFTTGTPWFDVNGNYLQYNVATAEQDAGSLLNWYQNLIRVRNASTALRRGAHHPLTPSDIAAMAYVRRDSQQTVLCLANTSGNSLLDLTVSGSAESLPPGDYTLTDLLDPAGTTAVTVTAQHEITGLELDAYEVRAYEFPAVSAVDPDPNDLPETGLRLDSIHPNPFNPATKIRYTLPSSSHVRVGIYDVAGREVVRLADEVQPEGTRQIHWDGRDGREQPVGAGVYFVRLETLHGTRLAKMTLVK